jgi:hypothetical protein
VSLEHLKAVYHLMHLMNNSPKHWEAPVSPNIKTHQQSPMEEDSNTDEDFNITINGRKNIENALRQPVVVDHFPSSLAGSPIESPGSHGTGRLHDGPNSEDQAL